METKITVGDHWSSPIKQTNSFRRNWGTFTPATRGHLWQSAGKVSVDLRLLENFLRNGGPYVYGVDGLPSPSSSWPTDQIYFFDCERLLVLLFGSEIWNFSWVVPLIPEMWPRFGLILQTHKGSEEAFVLPIVWRSCIGILLTTLCKSWVLSSRHI